MPGTIIPPFQVSDIVAATRGTWFLPPAPDLPPVTGIQDDSRKVQPGDLFVAIRGELADGHRFVEQAAAAGAAIVCVEQPPSDAVCAALRDSDVGCLLVEDGLKVFQALARAHRLRTKDVTVVGLTGSSGKTSTKEMIASVLEQRWPGQVLKTEGNTNNHFGVPRNLLRLTPQHRVAVLELGTNHPGEIAALTEMVVPDVGLVSNVGPAHLEFLGSIEGVAREKGALLSGLPPEGTAIYPLEAPHRDQLEAATGRRSALRFGERGDADVSVTYLGHRADGFGLTLHWRGSGESRELTWHVGGFHQALNAAAAATVGTVLGLSPDEIVAGLKACEMPGMRMREEERDGVHWVNDAYNANPASMRASIAWFSELTDDVPPASRIAVLGDMLELGRTGPSEHAAVLEYAQEALPGAQIVAVGPLMSGAAAGCGVRTCATAEDAATVVAGVAQPGSWVLLKASRGIHLERVLDA